MAKPEKIKHYLYNNTVEILFDDTLDKNGRPKHAYWGYDKKNLKKDGTPKLKRLTGVTTITGIIDKSRALIPWAVKLTVQYIRDFISKGETFTKSEIEMMLDEAGMQHTIKKETAGDIGTQIHEWAENFALTKGKDIELPKDAKPEVLNGISAFLDWYNGNDIEFVESERLIYSKKHGFVGTLDAVAKINGKLYLIDYKTSNGIYDEMKLQVSAYYKAYQEEMDIEFEGAMIIRFGKEDGICEVKEITKGELVKNYKAFKACLDVKNRLKEMAADYYKSKK